MLLLFALGHIPDHGEGPGHRVMFLPPSLHNLLHVPAYLLLAWLWARHFLAVGRPRPRAWILAVILATTFGAVEEVHQAFVPGRMAGVSDALLNLLGALLSGIPLRWGLFEGKNANSA